MPSPYARTALLCAALAPSFALAETIPRAADPSAETPPTQYRSVFEGYRRPASTDVGDWRRANDRVREVGGFAGALKDTLDAGTSDRSGNTPKPDHSGDGGHSR